MAKISPKQRQLNDRLADLIGTREISRKELLEICNRPEFGLNQIPNAFLSDSTVCERVGWGVYRVNSSTKGECVKAMTTTVPNTKESDTHSHNYSLSAEAIQMMGSTGGERDTVIPSLLSEYVPWGHFADIERIIASQLFAPVYITGMSGNGKTTMIEQVCAKLQRECYRVNIVGETDEDDLLGGFRLINGNTVWSDGPVVKAMRQGAVLLLDEIDLGTSKLMCLQPVLEGKGVYLKKINQWIRPQRGFTVIATANTKGKGSDDGRFVGTNVMNEAMLDRFDYTYNQVYAPRSVEKKIIKKAMIKFEVPDDGNFSDKLTRWSELIRKLFAEGSIDEIISTRRLVNIVKAVSMFKNREKAIRMCLSRFDDETSEAFFSAYSKVDDTMVPVVSAPTASDSDSDSDYPNI